MPRSIGHRQVVGHSADGGAPTARTHRCRSARRRRRDVVPPQSTYRKALTLATVFLFLDVSGGDRSPSRTMSEDVAKSVRRVDAVDGSSPSVEEFMQHSTMKIPDVSDKAQDEYSPAVEQSVSLQLLISLILISIIIVITLLRTSQHETYTHKHQMHVSDVYRS